MIDFGSLIVCEFGYDSNKKDGYRQRNVRQFLQST